MKKHYLKRFTGLVLLSILFCSLVQADTLIGLSDVTVEDGAIISIRFDGTEYVVADGDLIEGTTTRWYIDPDTGVETVWEEGGPTAPQTVAGSSNPKDGDVGSNADNFFFSVEGDADNISSIDGIDFQQTIFPFLTDTFFLFERGGNDSGTWQAIYADGSLGAPVSFNAANVYADTGIANGNQNAYGVVFKTDIPVQGVRISAPGHDTLSISTPAGADTRRAHDPQPENGAKEVSVEGIVLSWSAGVDFADPNSPNPNIVEHYLWISRRYDPTNPPSAPDWNDAGVQQFTISADTNPADGIVDAVASMAISGLQRDSLYFWVVDEGLVGSSGPLESDPTKIIWSNTWSFETVTSGPEVDAGSSVVTWLEAGTATVELNGTVADQTNDVTTIQWSVASSPSGSTVDIADSSVATTTASFTQTGRYILELSAVDATRQEDSDLMEVNVYADSCEAAKNNPSGYTAPQYDFNGDCQVNFADFAIFAEAWLQDASLAENVFYDAGTINLPPVVQFTNPLNGMTVSGEIIINAIAYDTAVGTTDGDGMLGDGYVFFEVIDGSGTVLGTQMENAATFDMTWDTTLPLYPNGVYTIRVTAESDAGEQTIEEISVTVNNP